MRVLLDTHALIWAVEQPTKLSPAAPAAGQDPRNERILSAGSIWETSIKVGPGKLRLYGLFRPWTEQAIADLGAALLPIAVEHADLQARLPFHHNDPFDRLLAAQSRVEGSPLVRADSLFDPDAISGFGCAGGAGQDAESASIIEERSPGSGACSPARRGLRISTQARNP